MKNISKEKRKLIINEAFVIFNKVKHVSRYLLNAFMQLLIDCRASKQALELYEMHSKVNDHISHMLAMKAYMHCKNMQMAHYIVDQKIIKDWNDVQCSTIETLNNLIDFYGVQCSDIISAQKVFHNIPSQMRDAITVNAMMTAFASNGKTSEVLELYEEYELFNDDISHVLAIKACIMNGSMEYAKNIIQTKILLKDENNVSIELLNTLIDFYGIYCSDICSAQKIFNDISIEKRDTVTIGALMKALIFNGKNEQALQLYEKYEQLNDSVSHLLAIKACINDGSIDYGKNIIQGKILLKVEKNIELLNTLIDFYGVHCSDISNAQKIFNFIPVKKRDSFTIGALMKSFTFNEQNENAVKLYEEYAHLHNSTLHLLAIKACVNIGNIGYAKNTIQSKIDFKDGNIHSIELLNTLIDFYGVHCLDINRALEIFHAIPAKKRNAITVGALMNVYLINDMNVECLQLFETSFFSTFDSYAFPDSVSFVIALQACTQATALHFGRKIHKLLSNDMLHDLQVQIALICMYGKCGQLHECTEIFLRIKSNEFEKYRNEIEIFHAMMNACAKNGDILQAIQVWNAMVDETPLVSNSKTYSILFTACSHVGDVVQARAIFDSIDTKDMKYDEFVRSSFVDVLSRDGCLDEALQSILEYEQNSDIKSYCCPMWMALLGGCRKSKNKDMSLIVYNHIQERFG